MKIPFLIGRAMFGGFFVYSGINHFLHREQLAQYANAKRLPSSDAMVLASGAAMVLGGSSIVLGVKPKLGVLAIAGFLASASPTMHDFWNAEDPNQRQNDMINFTKNLALMGAALALLGVDEPWPASVPVAQPDWTDRARSYADIASDYARKYSGTAGRMAQDWSGKVSRKAKDYVERAANMAEEYERKSRKYAKKKAA